MADLHITPNAELLDIPLHDNYHDKGDESQV